MLNYIKRLHRIVVRKIADTFDLPNDMNHHHTHFSNKHIKKMHVIRHRVLQHHHPNTEPRVLKEVQNRIGEYVGKMVSK